MEETQDQGAENGNAAKNKCYNCITILCLLMVAGIALAAVISLFFVFSDSTVSNAIWAPYIVMMTCVIVLGILLYVINLPVDE